MVDGGPCAVGVESTVVDLWRAETPRLLRPGGVTLEHAGGCAAGPVDVDEAVTHAPARKGLRPPPPA